MNLSEMRGWRRQRETVITPNATAALAGTAFEPLTKGTILTDAQWQALKPYSFGLDGSLAARIGFFLDLSTGASANNATCDYRCWLLTPCVGFDGVPTKQMTAELWFNGSLVAGTLVGSAGSKFLSATEHWCDQNTFTLSGVGTTIPGPAAQAETAMDEGVTQAYQATVPNNDLAHLMLPSMGRRGVIVPDFFNPSANARAGYAVALSGL